MPIHRVFPGWRAQSRRRVWDASWALMRALAGGGAPDAWAGPSFPHRAPALPYVGGVPRFRVTNAVLERHGKYVRARPDHLADPRLPLRPDAPRARRATGSSKPSQAQARRTRSTAPVHRLTSRAAPPRGDPDESFTNSHPGAGGPAPAPLEVSAVLSVWKLRHGQQAYYLEAVAEGVEDYYVGGEAPGRWIASSDATIGLAGEVSPDDLRAVLSGRDPSSGTRLGQPHKVPGFDLTFRAPKCLCCSVSVSRTWPVRSATPTTTRSRRRSIGPSDMSRGRGVGREGCGRCVGRD